jgi:hypothetical protein
MDLPIVVFLAVIAGAVLLAASLVAFFAIVVVLFPERVARTHAVAARTPGSAFLVGLVNGVFLTAIGLGLTALTQTLGLLAALPALVILIVLVIGLVLGLAGIVQLLGERLFPRREGIGRTGLSTLAVALGCALPYVGWFVLLPFLAMLGLGAFIISLVQDARRTTPAPAA